MSGVQFRASAPLNSLVRTLSIQAQHRLLRRENPIQLPSGLTNPIEGGVNRAVQKQLLAGYVDEVLSQAYSPTKEADFLERVVETFLVIHQQLGTNGLKDPIVQLHQSVDALVRLKEDWGNAIYAGLLAEQFLAKVQALLPTTLPPPTNGVYAQDYFNPCAQLLAGLHQLSIVDIWTAELTEVYQLPSGTADTLHAALTQILPSNISLESTAVQALFDQLRAVTAPTMPSEGVPDVVAQTMGVWFAEVYETYCREYLPQAEQDVEDLYKTSQYLRKKRLLVQVFGNALLG
ncbi:hypothetical protein H4R35_001454 [Dimargaris xerosporica]|nr:hypothetical protein H4R35_001454 [Dimargaris xerosporica]